MHKYYFILGHFIKYPKFANMCPRLVTQTLRKLHKEVFERNFNIRQAASCLYNFIVTCSSYI